MTPIKTKFRLKTNRTGKEYRYWEFHQACCWFCSWRLGVDDKRRRQRRTMNAVADVQEAHHEK